MPIITGNPYMSGIDPQWMQLWKSFNGSDAPGVTSSGGLASLADDAGPTLAVSKSPLPEPAGDTVVTRAAPVTTTEVVKPVTTVAADDAGVFAPVVARAQQASPATVVTRAAPTDTAAPAAGPAPFTRGWNEGKQTRYGMISLDALHDAAVDLGMGENPYLSGGKPRGYDAMMKAYRWFRERGIDYVTGQKNPALAADWDTNLANNVGYTPLQGHTGVYKTNRFVDPTTHQGPGTVNATQPRYTRFRHDLTLGANPYIVTGS